ncbi:hypothetical protein HYALB_00011648 [Hymenoscyphus albidus]|uniref:RRM domain-containing protein n=1 Tax=Hymenoscyphus albidus TaxID=595503 RepID=A0A9N9LSP5_9HELO|nr:hypothetical protein HYALB_00011648 [Hymenoscyphus albidus]
MSARASAAMSVANDEVASQASATESGGVPISGFAELTLDDEEAVEVKSTPSGRYSASKTKSKGYSPSSDRYRPPFVLKGNQALDDDPFSSPTRRVGSQAAESNQRTPTGPRTKHGAAKEDWRTASNSDSDAEISSPTRDKAERSTKRGNKSPGPKSSLVIQEYVSESPGSECAAYGTINTENAQSVFPPSCCVFVANLLQSESEESLQVAVTQVFREFGPVYVKIRRDAKHMPFAFCQYTNPEDAERAIREGRGSLIKGRPCRCEKAKAHRESSPFSTPERIAQGFEGLFYVERKYGTAVSPKEVRELLEGFGAITVCYTASNVERSSLNFNEGVIVEFEMYDEGQAAFAAFRNHDLYKIHAIAGIASPTKPQKSPASSADRVYLENYENDRCSIFIGNLPVGTTEAQVTQLFEHYGAIENIMLREAQSKYSAQEKFCFAFVKFTSPISVTRAIPGKNGFSFGGKILRVSQKDPFGAAQKSRASHNRESSTGSFQSPIHRNRNNSTASAMAQMSPAQFGSPYGTQFNPFYGTPSTGTLFTDGNGQFYTSPSTAPAYSSGYGATFSPFGYSLAGSPAYTTQASSSGTSGSPGHQQPYYSFGYPYNYAASGIAPAPSYGMYAPSQHGSSIAPLYPSDYSPATMTGSPSTTLGPKERSSTPNSVSHATTDELR